MSQLRVGLVALTMALSVSSSWAHHSGAAYDAGHTVTVSGVLKEFDWGAPHAQITIVVDENGVPRRIIGDSLAPNQISNQGFKPQDFKPGQHVEMSYNPHRNRPNYGLMISLKLEDGRVLQGGVNGPPGGVSLPPGLGVPAKP